MISFTVAQFMASFSAVAAISALAGGLSVLHYRVGAVEKKVNSAFNDPNEGLFPRVRVLEGWKAKCEAVCPGLGTAFERETE